MDTIRRTGRTAVDVRVVKVEDFHDDKSDLDESPTCVISNMHERKDSMLL